jgi:GAF domain-containing protein
LTEIPAQVLLLLPLVHNEEVVGVLELTATQAFGQAQREFLDRFCEHAAANLQTLRNQEYIR